MSTQYDHDDDDNYLTIISPPSGLIMSSPNAPIINYNPFGYNTFDTHNDDIDSNKSEESNHGQNDDEDKSHSNHSPNEYNYGHDHHHHLPTLHINQYEEDEDYEDGDELYTEFGIMYRRFCFSSEGIKFTIFLNIMMVLINTALIIYEIV